MGSEMCIRDSYKYHGGLHLQFVTRQGLMLDEVTLWPKPRTEGADPRYDPNHYIEEHSSMEGVEIDEIDEIDAHLITQNSMTPHSSRTIAGGAVFGAAAVGLAAGLALGGLSLRPFLRSGRRCYIGTAWRSSTRSRPSPPESQCDSLATVLKIQGTCKS